jgi:hypothetical protein
MMRYLCLWLIAILLIASDLSAQADHRQAVIDIYVLRAGEQLQSPHIVTYRVFEWEQMRGRWIAPDVGYYDTGYGKDQIWFAGAGGEVVHSKHVDWVQELYVLQEAGPESTDKRFMWLWPVLDFRFRPRVTGELVAYPTIPLDRAQRWAYDVDRSKIEWAATSHCLGASSSCQHSPFLTVTRATRAGNFEVWLQRVPTGAQVQLRYTLVHKENRSFKTQ